MHNRIKGLREDKDITQSQLAKELRISQRAYSHYEAGDRSIPLEILSRLADIYETSVDYLMDRTDTKKPYPRKK